MDGKNLAELKQFLQMRQLSQSQGATFGLTNSVRSMEVMEEAVAMDMDGAAPTMVKAQAAGGADDYSETNVQVKGVDEADFVKNDGQYIYMIADNKLLIIDAYDAENAEIISEIDREVLSIPLLIIY